MNWMKSFWKWTKIVSGTTVLLLGFGVIIATIYFSFTSMPNDESANSSSTITWKQVLNTEVVDSSVDSIVVHPFCFDFAMFGQEFPEGIVNCMEEGKDAELTQHGEGKYSAEFLHVEDFIIRPPLVFYSQSDSQPLNEKYRLFDVINGGGGSGLFSSIVLAEIISEFEINPIYLRRLGDRCNDGAAGIQEFDGEYITYGTLATPFRLLNPSSTADWRNLHLAQALAEQGDKSIGMPDTFKGWKPYKDVSNGAQHCVGRIVKKASMATGEVTKLHVQYDADLFKDVSDVDQINSCINTWIESLPYESNEAIPFEEWIEQLEVLSKSCD